MGERRGLSHIYGLWAGVGFAPEEIEEAKYRTPPLPEEEGMWRWRIRVGQVNYALVLLPRRFWWHIWTPPWHQGRGPYISIGLWVIAFVRGY